MVQGLPPSRVRDIQPPPDSVLTTRPIWRWKFASIDRGACDVPVFASSRIHFDDMARLCASALVRLTTKRKYQYGLPGFVGYSERSTRKVHICPNNKERCSYSQIPFTLQQAFAPSHYIYIAATDQGYFLPSLCHLSRLLKTCSTRPIDSSSIDSKDAPVKVTIKARLPRVQIALTDLPLKPHFYEICLQALASPDGLEALSISHENPLLSAQ